MKKKLPKILSESDVLKLFQAAWNPKHRIQFQLLYYCGLRVSEMLNLRVEDLDFKENILKVVSGKGGKDRLIPIPKPLKAALTQYIDLYKVTGRIIKTGRRNTNYMLRKYGKQIGKGFVHPHTLRHSYATHILEKTNNLLLVKDLLGHESIATTQIYTHLTTKVKKASIKNIWG